MRMGRPEWTGKARGPNSAHHASVNGVGQAGAAGKRTVAKRRSRRKRGSAKQRTRAEIRAAELRAKERLEARRTQSTPSVEMPVLAPLAAPVTTSSPPLTMALAATDEALAAVHVPPLAHDPAPKARQGRSAWRRVREGRPALVLAYPPDVSRGGRVRRAGVLAIRYVTARGVLRHKCLSGDAETLTSDRDTSRRSIRNPLSVRRRRVAKSRPEGGTVHDAAETVFGLGCGNVSWPDRPEPPDLAAPPEGGPEGEPDVRRGAETIAGGGERASLWALPLPAREEPLVRPGSGAAAGGLEASPNGAFPSGQSLAIWRDGLASEIEAWLRGAASRIARLLQVVAHPEIQWAHNARKSERDVSQDAVSRRADKRAEKRRAAQAIPAIARANREIDSLREENRRLRLQLEAMEQFRRGLPQSAG